jgi:hypothetical protein
MRQKYNQWIDKDIYNIYDKSYNQGIYRER